MKIFLTILFFVLALIGMITVLDPTVVEFNEFALGFTFLVLGGAGVLLVNSNSNSKN